MRRNSVDAVIVQAVMQRLGKWHALIKAAALMRRLRAGSVQAASLWFAAMT